METKLTIKNRLTLMGILDQMLASLAKRKMMNDLRDTLSLSAEEIELTEFNETVAPGGRGVAFHYDSRKDPMKKILINEVLCEAFTKHFTPLDKNEQIGVDLFPLCKLFIKEK